MQTEDDSNYVEDQSVRQGAKETDQDAAYQHGTDLVVIAHRNAFHIDVFAALSGHRCGGDHAEHGHHDGDSGGSKDGNCDGQFPFQEAEYSAIGDKPGQRPVVLAMPRLEMIEMRAIPSMKTGQMRGIRTQFMNQAGVRYSFFHSIIA